MKYEFQICDEVKTVDGRVGSIVKLTEITHRHSVEHHMTIEFSNGDSMSGYYNDKGIGYDDFCTYEELFKRIGKYDFTEKTEKKNKIEPLSEPENVLGVNIYCSDELARKINEIIDYINRQEINK